MRANCKSKRHEVNACVTRLCECPACVSQLGNYSDVSLGRTHCIPNFWIPSRLVQLAYHSHNIKRLCLTQKRKCMTRLTCTCKLTTARNTPLSTHPLFFYSPMQFAHPLFKEMQSDAFFFFVHCQKQGQLFKS